MSALRVEDMSSISTSTKNRPRPLADVRGVRVPHGTVTLLRELIHARTGMYYDDQRVDLLTDRLIPLALARGFDSLLDYYYLLKYDPAAEEEWARAIDTLSVQETYFWRESDQLKALTDAILPRLAARHQRPIRIWSLPCATGEEPLSLAIALSEAGWFARASIEIHAADASQAALQRARAGRYSGRAFRQIPDALRARYFHEDTKTGEWTIAPAIHDRVTSWTRLNVVQPAELEAVRGADVIFCRNLFIYFQDATVRRVVDAFADLMSSPGFLCVGAAESLLRVTTRFDLQDIAGAFAYVKS
jgi:chemotaxis protein methyltransferase CheR